MSEFEVHAPGRVNLIGEHTDQSGGLVLPAAIDRGVTIRAAPSSIVRLRSSLTGSEASFNLATHDGSARGPRSGWGRYVAAVIDELAALGRPPAGLEGEVTSDLPAGAGLSSSAALEIAVAVALCQAAEWRPAPMALAQACQRAEHAAVGVPCGLMDQAVSLLARLGHALLLDCDSLAATHVALPAEVAILIIDSGITRRLEDTPYALRSQEIAQAVSALSGRRPADVAVEEFDCLAATLPAIARRRLRHVVTENDRVRRVVALLQSPDPDSAELGALLLEGHASLRDDLEVSLPAIDELVVVAIKHGAWGARMTGAGFGGSIVALVPRSRAEDVAGAILADERLATRGSTRVLMAAPSAGAAQLLGW